MLQRIKSDFLIFLLLVGAFFVLLDIFFFNKGLIFSLIVASGMIYIGKKRMPKKTGTLLFWGGILFLSLSIMNMIAIKLCILALILFLIFQFVKRKREPAHITPVLKERVDESVGIHINPLFKNKLFGTQKTPDAVYEWNDVNIQTGVGDTEIDLSYTVLPKGESTIFIRNILGKITILVPYDVEISVNHSVLFGAVKILDYSESTSINKVIKVETAQYEQATQKVKLATSVIIGDIEVKRV